MKLGHHGGSGARYDRLISSNFVMFGEGASDRVSSYDGYDCFHSHLTLPDDGLDSETCDGVFAEYGGSGLSDAFANNLANVAEPDHIRARSSSDLDCSANAASTRTDASS